MKTLKDYIAEAEAPKKVYYRGTDNPNEDKLVRSKTLRASTNNITKKPEAGISVSDVDTVGDYFDYLYTLTGTEIGLGSDGEPLLDPDSISFVKWVKRPDK